MRIYKLSTIGEFHTNHNEDATAITEIGKDRTLMAVMDGCSMGKESHFASTLIAKLIRKIGKELSYKAFIEKTKAPLNNLLKEILNQLFLDLIQLKNQLHLQEEEILSTLIIGIIDEHENEVLILTIGDGLVCANGNLFEYEQDDKPDYLGYHLKEEFNQWYNNQSQLLDLKNVKDLSISTDGIFTFKNFDGKEYPNISEENIIESLLIDSNWKHQENRLAKKVLEIKNKFGLIPSDDLTILRFLLP